MTYLGEIKIWPAQFIPEGWRWCNGDLLSVQQNQALFSIIGNCYGGDGIRDFALPDLRGVFPIGCGKAPKSATLHRLASVGGSEIQTFTNKVEFEVPLPEHTHQATFTFENDTTSPVKIAVVDGSTTNTPQPGGNYLAAGRLSNGTIINNFTATLPAATPSTLAGVSGGGGGLKSGTVTLAKTGIKDAKVTTVVTGSIASIPPFLALGYIICCEGGDYPPQDADQSRLP